MGISGFTVFNSLYYIAAHYTIAINLGIIQSIMPAFIILISIIWLKIKISTIQIIGLLTTFIGVAIIVSKGNLKDLLFFEFNKGDLLLIFACLFYSIYAVGLKKRPKIDDLLLMMIFSHIAFLGSLPGLILEIINNSIILPTNKGILILFIIIIFPSLFLLSEY